MSNQIINKTITWQEVLTFVSPAGQKQLIDFVQRAKTERGAGWLEEIKIEYPTFCWIADLVCNQTAEDAYKNLQKEYPKMPLQFIRASLFKLHANLKYEIERKR